VSGTAERTSSDPAQIGRNDAVLEYFERCGLLKKSDQRKRSKVKEIASSGRSDMDRFDKYHLVASVLGLRVSETRFERIAAILSQLARSAVAGARLPRASWSSGQIR
jgi:hypothetical protein